MTKEEAIKTLRKDYCGERFFCELHQDGLCSTEDCEIWLAIKALETQPDGDAVSRRVVIDAIKDADVCVCYSENESVEIENVIELAIRATKRSVIASIEQMPPSQPEVAKDTNVPCTDTQPKNENEPIKQAQIAPNEDLISRKTAIDAVRMDISIIPFAKAREYVREAIETIYNRLEELPSAHPDLSPYSDKLWRSAYERGKAEAQAEIIACGDCKHWICHDRRCGYWNHGVKPLEWCCHAERRTDG